MGFWDLLSCIYDAYMFYLQVIFPAELKMYTYNSGVAMRGSIGITKLVSNKCQLVLDYDLWSTTKIYYMPCLVRYIGHE